MFYGLLQLFTAEISSFNSFNGLLIAEMGGVMEVREVLEECSWMDSSACSVLLQKLKLLQLLKPEERSDVQVFLTRNVFVSWF